MSGTVPEILYFKDAEGAFEYSCKYSFAEVREGEPRVALVENADGLQDDQGMQSAMLRVAGHNDYFNIVASTAGSYVPTLNVGELVLWVPMQRSPLPSRITDKRLGWLGLIVGVLAPELIVKTQSYHMKIDYRDYVGKR